jgi:hypothetical protein
MRTIKEMLESANQASITALYDVMSNGIGAVVKINVAEGDRYHKITREDMDRSGTTIENLSMPITDNDLADVMRRIDERKQRSIHKY